MLAHVDFLGTATAKEGASTNRPHMKIKTALKLLALVSALALPAVATAASLGLPLPASLDITHLIAGFVAVFISLIAFSDYARKPGGSLALRLRPGRKYVYPLAA